MREGTQRKALKLISPNIRSAAWRGVQFNRRAVGSRLSASSREEGMRSTAGRVPRPSRHSTDLPI
jgi:hypothetical protein